MSGRWFWIVNFALGVPILLVSMLGFGVKLLELIHLTTQGETDGGFAVTPVVNYLLASTGFLCLLLGAALNGMFDDIERPKYTMLENERKLDRQP